ncbi:mitochondrial K+-H+ exchange-related-domain-containing protein [Tirmania nivea]|nr:mitochondrial K+-H+ exchange-related-domain-containing protein [Tirmania nivea]
MKLFLIPITKRRWLIYAQQLGKLTAEKPSLLDQVTSKAVMTWQQWERGDKKWQRMLVEAGNKVLRRIPYEEWGLKSIPTLSSRKKQAGLHEAKIGVIYPPSVIHHGDVRSIIRQLATERAALHRSRLWWSVIGMPIVAPFALVPLIPNIPFFYLAFRAYSHWKALEGGKHLEFLLMENLLAPAPSMELDAIYKNKIQCGKKAQTQGNTENSKSDRILIDENDAQMIAKTLQVPGLAGELERAHNQVLLESKAHQRQPEPKKEV